MKVLDTMLSADAQNRIVYDGQDLLSYSQDVDLQLTEYLKDVKPVIEENHMYIRIASNDFFSVSLTSTEIPLSTGREPRLNGVNPPS